MSWMPVELVAEHATHGGQYVEVRDQELVHSGRRVITVTTNGNTLQLDVEWDARLIEHLAEALLKVLSDVKQAAKELERAAKKAAINAEVAA